MSTEEPQDEHRNVPLTPVYAFNDPGEAIDLYSGPIGGLFDHAVEGTIRLVPFPSPDLRWHVDVPNVDGYSTTEHVGDSFTLTANGISGPAKVMSASFGSVAGICSNLETESAVSLDFALVHWMNLPDYNGNTVLCHLKSDGGKTWAADRLTLEVDGWLITLDSRPDNSSLFREDVGLARYVLTHVMELRRADGTSFDVDSVSRVIEALRLSFSFAAGRWVAPPLSVGFHKRGERTWQRWVAPICAPYQKIGSPIISPLVVRDLEAFLKASVARLHGGNAANTTRFQMQLATQTSDLGFVDNRIITAFPAIENLSWETFVLGSLESRRTFEGWNTARRLRELLVRAQIPVDVDKDRLPALHQLADEKGVDGPEAVTWVRNRLIHPKDPHDSLYARKSLVVDAWQQSREYICLLVLHAIGYRGGYLGVIPPHGWLGAPVPVPWAAPDEEKAPAAVAEDATADSL